MSDRIVMRVGEALVIGELDGPFGTAFTNLPGDQVKGHSRVLAILNTDIMVNRH